ncbi:MAG: type II secretion system GspH family protein [Deltaproteobacteria bacterium]|nr:type II secretion system GspH family protein [Deltaproteobacteria bacterium]
MGRKGFTLIEVIITAAIIATLASVAMPLSRLAVKRRKELELRQSLRAVRNALDEYKRAWDYGRLRRSPGESGYPPDLKTLEHGVEDAAFPGSGRRLRFLRRVPQDPMNNDAGIPAEETWGLRSYQSGPDEPEEGADVFDVYSKSDELGIDNTPYRAW